MTAGRACAGVIALAAVALAVVCLRAEQTRVAAQALGLERRFVALRGELWQLQTGVARLRTPVRLQERVDWFDVGLASVKLGRIGFGEVPRAEHLPIN